MWSNRRICVCSCKRRRGVLIEHQARGIAHTLDIDGWDVDQQVDVAGLKGDGTGRIIGDDFEGQAGVSRLDTPIVGKGLDDGKVIGFSGDELILPGADGHFAIGFARSHSSGLLVLADDGAS